MQFGSSASPAGQSKRLHSCVSCANDVRDVVVANDEDRFSRNCPAIGCNPEDLRLRLPKVNLVGDQDWVEVVLYS
jgi:hypothetical protein